MKPIDITVKVELEVILRLFPLATRRRSEGELILFDIVGCSRFLIYSELRNDCCVALQVSLDHI